jgi:hypothetical protein
MLVTAEHPAQKTAKSLPRTDELVPALGIICRRILRKAESDLSLPDGEIRKRILFLTAAVGNARVRRHASEHQRGSIKLAMLRTCGNV